MADERDVQEMLEVTDDEIKGTILCGRRALDLSKRELVAGLVAAARTIDRVRRDPCRDMEIPPAN